VTSKDPVIVVVTGPPGCGSSTVADHVAGKLHAPVRGWDNV